MSVHRGKDKQKSIHTIDTIQPEEGRKELSGTVAYTCYSEGGRLEQLLFATTPGKC
jgi:hypothetical protein